MRSNVAVNAIISLLVLSLAGVFVVAGMTGSDPVTVAFSATDSQPTMTGSDPVMPPPVTVTSPSGVIYLTFDDGPDLQYTPQILDVLAKYNVNATFFMVGRYVDLRPILTGRAYRLGNSIQNHTYDHHTLRNIPADLFQSQVARGQDAITKATGVAAQCVRPPYDESNQETVDRLGTMSLKEMGWTVDSEDWKLPGVDAIVARVVNGVRADSVVLMHDSGGDRSQTVAALDQIIPQLRDRGFGFGVLCK